ncbi:MAG: ergothioneine biosynthesis protein EgtB [Candidatus Korobacteraceae bacterium]
MSRPMPSTDAMRSSPDAQRSQAELSLLEQYLKVRKASQQLCAPLTTEDHSLQPMPDASPAKWHLAHTTWFFETFILSQYAGDYRSFHPAFRNLFNSYYNAVGDRPLRSLRHILSRPSLDEVRAYRSHVDEAMFRLLMLELPPSALDLIALGMNHEQQHQELIVTDVKNGLWSNPLRPAYRDGEAATHAAASVAALEWHSFPEGVYEFGFHGSGFAFDNEGPPHKVYLQPFRLASRLVTNGEYLDFVRDGGYSQPRRWLSDGWDTVRNSQWSAPLYWEQRDGEWCTYTIEGMQPVRLNDPVCHISYYEADAFARWSGARLPSEFEWELAARSYPVAGNLMETGELQPRSADSSQPFAQIFGDVWEWTASAYLPYPGFAPAAGAVGEYNGKFMSNQMVLRGGSCATPTSHIRATYRNFFPPHVRWQFMGMRLANGD